MTSKIYSNVNPPTAEEIFKKTKMITIKIKDPNRLELQKQRERQGRINEKWTRGCLIEELYLCLMSHKFKDEEGITRRKYEEKVSREIGWMAIPPYTTTIDVHLKDLDDKIKQELLSDDPIMRDFTLKEAVGMICEQVNNRCYLLSAKQFLKVRLI